jgi:hypothetical protein
MFYIVTAQYVDENSNNGEGTGDYNSTGTAHLNSDQYVI